MDLAQEANKNVPCRHALLCVVPRPTVRGAPGRVSPPPLATHALGTRSLIASLPSWAGAGHRAGVGWGAGEPQTHTCPLLTATSPVTSKRTVRVPRSHPCARLPPEHLPAPGQRCGAGPWRAQRRRVNQSSFCTGGTTQTELPPFRLTGPPQRHPSASCPPGSGAKWVQGGLGARLGEARKVRGAGSTQRPCCLHMERKLRLCSRRALWWGRGTSGQQDAPLRAVGTWGCTSPGLHVCTNVHTLTHTCGPARATLVHITLQLAFAAVPGRGSGRPR